MSENKKFCEKCGESIDSQSTNIHKCSNNGKNLISDLVFCEKCSSYLSKLEYKDHLLCHSLESENELSNNLNIDPEINTINSNFINRNINDSSLNRNIQTINYNQIPGQNIQSFNNRIPIFDSNGFSQMMQNSMQNMNLQMQSMNNNLNNQNYNNLSNLNRNLNLNMSNLNRNLNNDLNNLNRNLNLNMTNLNRNLNNNLSNSNRSQYSNFNSNFNNMTSFQMNSGNNHSISSNVVYDPVNRISIVTVNRNGVISTHRIRDGENTNYIINQLINSGFIPNDELINSFPEREITQSNLESSNEQKSCIICLNDFALSEKVITLPCLHIFHSNCIRPWLNSNDECPICKHNINE